MESPGVDTHLGGLVGKERGLVGNDPNMMKKGEVMKILVFY